MTGLEVAGGLVLIVAAIAGLGILDRLKERREAAAERDAAARLEWERAADLLRARVAELPALDQAILRPYADALDRVAGRLASGELQARALQGPDLDVVLAASESLQDRAERRRWWATGDLDRKRPDGRAQVAAVRVAEVLARCPRCGYPDTFDGGHFKGIYDPARFCPLCAKPPEVAPAPPPGARPESRRPGPPYVCDCCRGYGGDRGSKCPGVGCPGTYEIPTKPFCRECGRLEGDPHVPGCRSASAIVDPKEPRRPIGEAPK